MEKIKIIHNSSYHTQRPHISKIETEVFKYPVVYYVRKDDTLSLQYSNINDRGHFGIPKVIFSKVIGSGTFIDYNGEYGLTEFVYGIVDKPENLILIKKAMDNPDFIKLVYNGNDKYDYKVISLFRKDFYKEFV